jgi:hypothetical protein
MFEEVFTENPPYRLVREGQALTTIIETVNKGSFTHIHVNPPGFPELSRADIYQ